MNKAWPPAFLLLAACSGDTLPPGQPEAAKQAAAPPAAPAAAPAQARQIEEKGDLLELTYGWSAEAASIPELAARFEAEVAKDRKEALAAAAEDKAARGAEIPFNSHYFSKTWSTLGSADRLLSLAAEIGTFTGGAHGNSAYQALLWDRQAGREIALGQVFSDAAAADRLIEPVYCAELDKQRAEKRQEPLPLKGDDWMVQCPPIDKEVVAPVDDNKDGRFERLRVLIGPYDAGPYAEGTYEVDVPVTPKLRALVKPAYRDSF